MENQSSVSLFTRDAPAESYFLADDLNKTERRELYLELRKKAGVAAIFNRTDEDVFAQEADKEEEKEKALKEATEAEREDVKETAEKEAEEKKTTLVTKEKA